MAMLVTAIQMFLLACVSAHAMPITSIDHLNNFRDTRGLNDVGIAQGDSIQFGADVVPNGLQGTTMSAVQGARTLAPALCNALAVDANFCARSVAFSPALNGSWALSFQNGSDTATAVTPVLGAAAASPAPFLLSIGWDRCVHGRRYRTVRRAGPTGCHCIRDRSNLRRRRRLHGVDDATPRRGSRRDTGAGDASSVRDDGRTWDDSLETTQG